MPFLIPLGAAIATGVGFTGTAATIVGGLTTIGLGTGLAFGAKSLLTGLLPGSQTPTAPQAPAAATASSAEEIKKQADITAQKNKLALARRKRTGTTLTSPQGLLSTEQSSQKSLLGG